MPNYTDPTFCIRIVQFILSLVCYGIFCGTYETTLVALMAHNSYTEYALAGVIRGTIGLTAIVFFPAVVFPVSIISFVLFPETKLSPLVALYDGAGTICYFSAGIILITNISKFSNLSSSAGVMAGFCILTAFVYGTAIGLFLWNYMVRRKSRNSDNGRA